MQGVKFVAYFAICLAVPAQVPPALQDNSSCGQFVQQFYDWYVPLTQTRTDEPSSFIAIQRKSNLFHPNLVRALKVDFEAQARAEGELVGIDFDPFVASQDPADHYKTRHVTWRANRCSVEVWRASPRDMAAKSVKPSVIADVKLVQGHWQFQNFRYPDGADLVSVLNQLQKERRK